MLNSSSDGGSRIAVDDLVRQAQLGDQRAFVELVERHIHLVRRTAYAIVRNSEDAEDVAQDVVMRLLLKLSTFAGNSSFSTWLTRITINTSLMHIRKIKRVQLLSIDEVVEGSNPAWLIKFSDKGPDPEQQYFAKEARSRLYEQASLLPAKLKPVLLKHITDEISMAELANQLGLSVPATKSRNNRARKLLLHRLNPVGFPSDHPTQRSA